MKQVFSLILFVPLFISAQGIKFEQNLTWNQVLQKAKAENKYIFVDCYATWCGPCKEMDKYAYTKENVGSYYNKNFISVKVQMDTAKSDNDFIKGWYADARKIQKTYNVNSFPTYLFFTPNGDIVHKDVGAKASDYFITVGADALNPEKQYYVTLEKYRRNDLDTAYIKPLARKVRDLDGEELGGKIANDYIKHLSSKELFTKDNIWLMYEFTKSSKDRGFKIFRDHAKRIHDTDDRFTQDACKSFVIGIINREEIKPYTTTKDGKPDWKKIKNNLKKYGSLGDEAFTRSQPGIIFKSEIEPALKINSDWDRILPVIEKLKLGKNAEFVVGSAVVYYVNAINVLRTEKDCKNLVAAASYYADSFPTFLRATALNGWAWTVFANSNNKSELNRGLAWVRLSLDLEGDEQSPEAMDTYANLLYKVGRVQEAIQWETKAFEADAARGTNLPVYRESLEKMKKGESTWPKN